MIKVISLFFALFFVPSIASAMTVDFDTSAPSLRLVGTVATRIFDYDYSADDTPYNIFTAFSPNTRLSRFATNFGVRQLINAPIGACNSLTRTQCLALASNAPVLAEVYSSDGSGDLPTRLWRAYGMSVASAGILMTSSLLDIGAGLLIVVGAGLVLFVALLVLKRSKKYVEHFADGSVYGDIGRRIMSDDPSTYPDEVYVGGGVDDFGLKRDKYTIPQYLENRKNFREEFYSDR